MSLLRLLASIVLAVFLSSFLAGCGNADREKLEAISDFAYDTGLDAEISGTFGDGHFAGQAFNFTGLHGSFRLSGKPQRRTTDIQGAVK